MYLDRNLFLDLNKVNTAVAFKLIYDFFLTDIFKCVDQFIQNQEINEEKVQKMFLSPKKTYFNINQQMLKPKKCL